MTRHPEGLEVDLALRDPLDVVLQPPLGCTVRRRASRNAVVEHPVWNQQLSGDIPPASPGARRHNAQPCREWTSQSPRREGLFACTSPRSVRRGVLERCSRSGAVDDVNDADSRNACFGIPTPLDNAVDCMPLDGSTRSISLRVCHPCTFRTGSPNKSRNIAWVSVSSTTRAALRLTRKVSARSRSPAICRCSAIDGTGSATLDTNALDIPPTVAPRKSVWIAS